MNAFIGMSIEEASKTSESLKSSATQVQAAMSTAKSALSSAEWVGEDHEAFIASWGSISSDCDEFVQALHNKSAALLEESQEQTTASQK